MRLIRCLTALTALTAIAAIASSASLLPHASAQTAPASDAAAPKSPEDLLGTMVVVAGAGRALPKIAVAPSLGSDLEDVTIRSVVRRDLDLSGEFEVLDDSQVPSAAWDSAMPDSPVDIKAWAGRGLEAVVKVSGKPAGAGKSEIRGQAYLLSGGEKGSAPVFDKRFLVATPDLRVESHRVADLVIGALTGQNGGFASHMAFASGTGGLRRVYTMDADGNDPEAASPVGSIGISPAFGKGEDLHYAASTNSDEYRVFSAKGGPMALPVRGSVYGIAFSRDRSQVAISVAVGRTINVFAGPDLASVAPASDVAMALHPAFTPSGKLSFAGAGTSGQRIYVDGKPISPDGLFASSPTFCNHPDGVRAVFAVGVGKDTDLVSTGERGGPLVRLTQGQGRNGYPACSPDGRLIAFFSTRASGPGPGLYVMRLDGGGRAKRVSSMLGDSLRWDALPKGSAVELKN
jgi:TolB protein